jgi:hypothetical protein
MKNPQILSPDGFPINRDGEFKTKKIALDYFENWKKQYERQGYYSSVDHGKIPLDKLKEHCTFVNF